MPDLPPRQLASPPAATDLLARSRFLSRPQLLTRPSTPSIWVFLPAMSQFPPRVCR
jgi:hypothetical protein